MSPVRPASRADGLRSAVQGSTAAAPGPPPAAPAPGRRPRPPKPATIRYTLDLDPGLHRFMKEYAAGVEADASEVLRSLLGLLRDDAALAGRVRDRLWSQ